ncbi:MAG TPA: GNAT family N-acetyltransferase [Candidatus Woesebacteria bacterium]|nr:GNAT family N-acetyltransferase [Candidatus Woesebacteria bacterium]
MYFEDEKSIALHQIVVAKEHQGKGVATKLLQSAIKELSNKKINHLFSIVTTGPVTNCPSIIWHTAMGFNRACVTSPIDLFGLKNYTSLLFHKFIGKNNK